MTLPVHIVGSGPDRIEAKVTSRGELVTGKIAYSSPYNVTVAAAATSYEIVPAKASKAFVMTDIFISTDKDYATSTTAVLLQIYTAHPADLDTSIQAIFNIELFKNDRFSATGLNIITGITESIVVTAADTASDVTLAGYYVDA
jgi:hypothetical protein